MCKRFEDFEAESKQYNQIILNYLDNGHVFADPNFHPNKHIPEKNQIFNEDNTEWKRIDEIYQAPLFKKELIGINFIEQGDLDDFFFINAISYLSTQPEKVPFLFDHRVELHLGKEEDTINLKCGAVVIYLHAFGKRVPVLIDTLIPISKTTQKAIFSRPINDTKSPWFCLVEKAFAKLNDSYSKIADATFSQAIYSLYGFYSTNKRLSSLKSEVKNSVMSPFDRIQKYLNQHSIIGASIHIQILDGLTEKDVNQKGLLKNQTYLILSAKKVTDTNLLCLRNPSQKNVWNGFWSNNSELWTSEMKKSVDIENFDDGTFWMSDSDFLKYFTDIDVSKPIPNRWYLREFFYQLKPSYNDGFDIESEEANLTERPNFAFKIIEPFESGKNCRFHIFVERRQTVNNRHFIDEKVPFCVFLVSNSGKKLLSSELPYCRRYQKTTRSNIISFPYTVSSNDEILTFVLYRLNKSEFIEDCYVKIFCERDFKLYNVDEPEKSISEDKITFSNNIKFDRLLLFSNQDNNNDDDPIIEEEEEVADETEKNKNMSKIIIEEEEEVSEKIDLFNLLKKNYDLNKTEINQNDQNNRNDEFNLLKINDINNKFDEESNQNENDQNNQLNNNNELNKNDDFNLLEKVNDFNKTEMNQNDQINQNDEFNLLKINDNNNKLDEESNQNENDQLNNDFIKNDDFNLLKKGNDFNKTEINQNDQINKNDEFNLLKNNNNLDDKNNQNENYLFTNQINKINDNQNSQFNGNARNEKVAFNEEFLNTTNSNDITNNDINKKNDKLPNKKGITKIKSIILNENNFYNSINSNKKLQTDQNSNFQSNEANEKIPEINSIQPTKNLEEETSHNNEPQNTPEIEIIHQNEDILNNLIQPHKNLEEEETSHKNEPPNSSEKEIINSNEVNEKIPKIYSINQPLKNLEEEETINVNEPNPSKTGNIHPNEKMQEIQSINQQHKKLESPLYTNDQVTLETEIIHPNEKVPETHSIHQHKSLNEASPASPHTNEQDTHEVNEINHNEQEHSSPHRHSRRSSRHKSSSQKKISKETLQNPSKSIQQRKSAHQKLNEPFLTQMTRKSSPISSKHQPSVIKSQKSDSTLDEDIRPKYGKNSPNRNSGEMKSEKMSDTKHAEQHTINMSSKKQKQPSSPKTALSNKDMHKMFNSITDNFLISRYTDKK